MAGAQENARAAKCPFQINKERAPLAQITKRVRFRTNLPVADSRTAAISLRLMRERSIVSQSAVKLIFRRRRTGGGKAAAGKSARHC